MEISVAEPHGMCTGVARALRIADEILTAHRGETLWCFHEIVHNEHVVTALRDRGVKFVQDLALIPYGARTLFSAHGVSPAIRAEAFARHLEIVDATCPFVAKVHEEAKTFAAQKIPIVLIGHKGHDEITGIVGEATPYITVIETLADIQLLEPTHATLAVLSQTTISSEMYEMCIAELKRRGFNIVIPKHHDICYATQERQDAVRALTRHVDHMIVIGSRTSSNSKRLAEVAQSAGCPTDLIASPEELSSLDLSNVRHLGLTSGASTPEALLDTVRTLLSKR